MGKLEEGILGGLVVVAIAGGVWLNNYNNSGNKSYNTKSPEYTEVNWSDLADKARKTDNNGNPIHDDRVSNAFREYFQQKKN